MESHTARFIPKLLADRLYGSCMNAEPVETLRSHLQDVLQLLNKSFESNLQSVLLNIPVLPVGLSYHILVCPLVPARHGSLVTCMTAHAKPNALMPCETAFVLTFQ